MEKYKKAFQKKLKYRFQLEMQIRVGFLMVFCIQYLGLLWVYDQKTWKTDW